MFFIHIRNMNKNGEFDAKGGFTFAVQPIYGTKNFLWGMSKCNKKDWYCKKIGRENAKMRLESIENSFITPEMDKSCTYHFAKILTNYLRKSRPCDLTIEMINSALSFEPSFYRSYYETNV